MKTPPDALDMTIITGFHVNLLTTFLTSSENKISNATKCYKDYVSPLLTKVGTYWVCKIKHSQKEALKMKH